ncbi:MAG TPA: exonuclease SbcCD subunit D [Candidatus Nanoarchaeia archaeon]|nr:exonuclease SbcCD subunit D [Candidatus Nanoarchaeia archaeon]
MRILHTSDWHIGKKIYDQSRMDEYSKFLDWLLAIIIEKRIDVLLVSGDIFDSSVPPAEATDLYYRFLFDLHQNTDARAVLIAGNHDSAVRLAAPRDFLKMADIHVVGSIRNTDCVVFMDIGGQTVAFAAVPYLNEGDILEHVSFEKEVERSMRYREALKNIYVECIAAMQGADLSILMGHYFIQGSVASDSERLVQIGGIQSVHTEDLPYGVDYIALGHLHRPQQIPGNGCPIVYPGSPLPLSFKEAEYDKKVFLIDFNGEASEMEEIIVPTFRELVRVEGTLDDVKIRANFEDWKDKYIEVRVQLAGPQIGVGDEIRQAFENVGGRVLVVESMLPENDRETISAAGIKTRSPAEIFQEYYNYRYGDSSPEELDEMLVTFNELLEISSEEVAD